MRNEFTWGAHQAEVLRECHLLREQAAGKVKVREVEGEWRLQVGCDQGVSHWIGNQLDVGFAAGLKEDNEGVRASGAGDWMSSWEACWTKQQKGTFPGAAYTYTSAQSGQSRRNKGLEDSWTNGTAGLTLSGSKGPSLPAILGYTWDSETQEGRGLPKRTVGEDPTQGWVPQATPTHGEGGRRPSYLSPLQPLPLPPDPQRSHPPLPCHCVCFGGRHYKGPQTE